MDYVRRCYRTVIKPWQGSDATVAIRWYRAAPGAKVYEGWSRFRSLSTWCRGEPAPPIGEQLPARETTYDRGLNTGEWQGDHWEGPPEAWADGGILGVTPVIHTDDKGGTPGCPWNGPPGPVAIATVAHGKGWVVAIGGSTLIRDQADDGSPEPGWNDDFWHQFGAWLRDVGKNQPIASAGDASSWRQLFARPTTSYVGSADDDYSTEAQRYALQQQLHGLAVLYTGWTGLDYDGDHQWLNTDIYYVVKDWLINGGVLVIVNAIATYDHDSPLRNNALLDALNVEMQFEHGDYGPSQWHRSPGYCFHADQTLSPTWASWSSLDNLTSPYPNAAYCLLDPMHPDSQIITMLWSNLSPTVGTPTAAQVQFWIWRDGGGTVSGFDFYQVWSGVSKPAHFFVGDVTTTPTLYSFGGLDDPSEIPVASGFPSETVFQIHRQSGSATVYISGPGLTAWYCPGAVCGPGGLVTNDRHPIVTRPSGSRLCGIQWNGGSSIVGGRWVGAWAPQTHQRPCAGGGLIIGGSARQRGGSGQHASGGIIVNGQAFQAGGHYQTTSGGIGVAGNAGQVTFPTQIARGGIIVAGQSGQSKPPVRQATSGGIILNGQADQRTATGGGHQTASGGIIVAGDADQRTAGGGQSASGGIGVAGDSTQGL